MPKTVFHPDLRLARFLPRATTSPRMFPVQRLLGRLSARRPKPGARIVAIDENVTARVFRAASGGWPAPGLLWIHGGGYVLGTAADGDAFCRLVAEELDVTVASVEYRLAPENPFPVPLEDCYAGLRWLARDPGVDSDRIAVGGASAGGGLAAATALLARERGEIRPVLQLLCYPMLDDRTTARTDLDPSAHRIWNQNANRFGWRSYLGDLGSGDVPPLAAPARCEDLRGLPPAWIGVGTHDLFHDEDVAYARRLAAAGVPCTLRVVPDAYHGFDVVETWAGVSRTFQREQLAALDAALTSGAPRTGRVHRQ